jgi:hypothetical protein
MAKSTLFRIDDAAFGACGTFWWHVVKDAWVNKMITCNHHGSPELTTTLPVKSRRVSTLDDASELLASIKPIPAKSEPHLLKLYYFLIAKLLLADTAAVRTRLATMSVSLDPHARPPAAIQEVYKRFQKLGIKAIEDDSKVIDIRHLEKDGRVFRASTSSLVQLPANIRGIFVDFAGDLSLPAEPTSVYGITEIPGM